MPVDASIFIHAIPCLDRGAKGPAPPVWSLVLELQTANARCVQDSGFHSGAVYAGSRTRPMLLTATDAEAVAVTVMNYGLVHGWLVPVNATS